jgi:hypothetical protein
MAGTNRFMNWQNGQFTPSGGSSIALVGVTKCDISANADIIAFKGDIAKYDQVVAAPTSHRIVTVDFADAHTAMIIASGTFGSFSIQLLDAQNGAVPGGGGFTVALANCVVGNKPVSDSHAQYATAQLTFQGYDPTGGLTDPMTVTPL